MQATDDRHLFFAFSRFTGERSVFDAWYDQEHIPQVLGAPGLTGAQRFDVAPTKPLPGTAPLDFGHLALYELEGRPGPFREEVKRLLIEREMVLPEFMIQPFTALFLKPVSEPFRSKRFARLADFDDRHLFLVFSQRPADGEAYDQWYDKVHIPQVMSAPGMLRAQRFVTSDVRPLPGVATPELGHLALYEVAGDLLPLREEVKRQLISGEMELPEFMRPPFESMFMRPASRFAAATGTRERSTR